MRISIAIACLLSFSTLLAAQTLRLYEGQLIGPREQVIVGQPLAYPIQLDFQLPRITGSKMDQVLNGPRTIFYKLPQVYQQFVPASKTEHKNLTLGTLTYSVNRPVWGLYQTSFLSQFNANPDFPWEVTIGLNLSHRESVKSGQHSPYGTVNFLSLPEDDSGKLIPIILLVDERPIQWIFPPGTTVGEIIYAEYQGRKYVQEVRTRTKSEGNKTWYPGVFRPIKYRREFQYLTGLAYEPGFKFMTFRNPEEDEVLKLEGTVEKLPPLNTESVKALLSRPFQDCTQSNWSPMSEQDFHILPKDYSFGILKSVDAETCANCHRQTGISVRNLIPKEPLIIRNPFKVGNIRGCDAVFTWHPFDMRTVRSNDLIPMPRQLYCRNFDIMNGIIELIHKGQTPEHKYQITRFVQASLKPYELPSPQYLHDFKTAMMEEDDGLSHLDRQVQEVVSVVPGPVPYANAPIKEPSKVSKPIQEIPRPAKISSLPRYKWEFRGELNPGEYLRNVLIDTYQDKIIGVYWAPRDVYLPYDGRRLLAAAEPPIPVPDAMRGTR